VLVAVPVSSTVIITLINQNMARPSPGYGGPGATALPLVGNVYLPTCCRKLEREELFG